MSRQAAVLKVMALCGGVVGGLLLVVGLVMVINFCRKRCVRGVRKAVDDAVRRNMPTITVSPPTESLRVSSNELHHPQYEPVGTASVALTRTDSQQPVKASNPRQATTDVAIAAIEIASKGARTFRDAPSSNRSYGSLQDRDDASVFDEFSAAAAQKHRRAESRRAAFKRNRQSKSQRADSRRGSRSSGSFEMDAIAEMTEEAQAEDLQESRALSQAETDALKRQYEEVRALAAKQAFRHTKPITWDVSHKLQQVSRPRSSALRAQSAGAAMLRMQRYDSFEQEEEPPEPEPEKDKKPFLEIWRLRSTFESEDSELKTRDLSDKQSGTANSCAAEQQRKSSVSKREKYKQALLRRRQMQHLFPNMADSSLDSNTTDGTSGRPADTATSFESNTSTATGMSGNSGQLSIISSVSVEDTPQANNSVSGSGTSLLGRTIGSTQSPSRDIRQVHSQHTVIMLTPAENTFASESRRRIDSGYRSVEHRSLSLAASDVVVPTRSRTLDAAEDGFQCNLRPPAVLLPQYMQASDHRSRFASASAAVRRTSSSRLTSLDSERDSVIVDEDELSTRPFDTSPRSTHFLVAQKLALPNQLQRYQLTKRSEAYSRSLSGSGSRSNQLVTTSESASSHLHYAQLGQRKLAEMSVQRSYELAAPSHTLVRGYSQPYAGQTSQYLPPMENSSLEKHYFGTGLVRFGQYDYARPQTTFSGSNRRLPNPVAVTNALVRSVPSSETGFASVPQSAADDANHRATMHNNLRYF